MRLWPLSRRQQPKQFIPLAGDTTLFEDAVRRVSDRSRFLPPLIICHEDHQFLVLMMLQKLGIMDAHVLLEPAGKNTAAAAIVAALYELSLGAPDSPLHLVMPCDQSITDESAFAQAVTRAYSVAAEHLVLLGITPHTPETGYGYIVPDMQSPALASGVHSIRQFKEKPVMQEARNLIAEGALWNSGMFIYAPAVMLAEASQLTAADYVACSQALSASTMLLGAHLLSAEAYDGLSGEPFDRAIMEQTTLGAVVPCDMGWSDLGTWQALWQQSPQDAAQNVVRGAVTVRDSRGCYLYSEGQKLAVLGIENCVAVASKDAVLIAPRERANEIKSLLAEMEETVTDQHSCVFRPWGTYEVIAQGTNFKVKHIVVQPGCALSLQMHRHRAEHWVVVCGMAQVTCDGVERLVYPNQSVFVPQGAVHRLANPAEEPLQLIEVQSGDYISDDDITRFEDIYGRAVEGR